MPYRVIVTPEAESDLRKIYTYIRGQGSPEAARTWLHGARQKIKSLARQPERAGMARESGSFPERLRELLYGHGNRGTYRIIFVIIDLSVFVLHVRHGSRLPLEPEA